MSLNTTQPEALKLCLLSVPEDQKLSENVEKQLQLLKRRGLITFWSMQEVKAGNDWRQEREAQLSASDLIVFLVSTDFLISEDYAGLTLKNVLERYRQGAIQVIPVLLRPVDLENLELFLPLPGLKVLPDAQRAVTLWQDLDSAMQAICLGIKQAVQDFKAKRRGSITVKTAGAALPPPIKLLRNVPHRRNPLFTGQENALTTLYEHLHDPAHSSPATQALTGLGGVGKTQIALEYVYRYGPTYREVLWLRADTLENLTADGLVLAQNLRLAVRNDSDQTRVLAALRRWLEQHQNWLLVLDHVEHLKIVTDFLPVQSQGHILITTRAQATKGVVQKLQIDSMDSADGTLLLLRRAGIDEPDERTEAQAREIVQMLGGLPLAVDQAGAYIEDTNTSLANYIEFYQQRRTVLLNRRGSEQTEHPASVAATFSLAFAQMEQEYQPAADLLRLCAFLHPDQIPDSLFSYGASLLPWLSDRWELDVALETLLTFSLVQRQRETRTLSVHRLVQDVLKDTLTEEDQRLWAEKTVLLVSKAWPEPTFAHWKDCQAYLPHALACAELLHQWQFPGVEGITLLLGLGSYLSKRAAYHEAGRILHQALNLSELHPGLNDLTTAMILHELGWLAHCQDLYTRAEDYYQQALMIRERKLGLKNTWTLQTLQKIGLLALNRREYEQAEPLLKQVLELREQLLGPDQPEVAETLNTLGRLARARKNYGEAEIRYKHALAIYEQALGLEAPETALCVANLAVLYFDQRNYQQAEPYYQRALALREQTLGAEHPDTALMLDGLATVYRFQSRYREAEPLSRRALTIQIQVLGLEHLETAQSQMTLAMILYGLEDYPAAAVLCEQALATRKLQLKPGDTRLITNFSNLALIYQALQKYDQALTLFQYALALSSEVSGPEDSSTQSIRDNLKKLHQQMDLPAETSSLDRQALTAQEQEPHIEKDQK